MSRPRFNLLQVVIAVSLLPFTLHGHAANGDADRAPREDAQRVLPVTAQPEVRGDIAKYFITPTDEPKVDTEALSKLLQKKIKYVFVIFNENHSFDNEYGTFPGANGLYSDGQKPRSSANTPGYTQRYVDKISGSTLTVTPFLIRPALNSNVVDSVDHSHVGLAAKLHVDPATNTAALDGFSQAEYTKRAGAAPTAATDAKGRQFAALVMSHIDCDTIPFFWKWASRFTTFDNIFATEDTPSTPNAVAMIAGQSGETQWVKHPSTTAVATATGFTGPLSGTINGVDYNGQTGTTQGPPLVNDPQPFYGSQFDKTVSTGAVIRQPSSPHQSYSVTNIASNLTFASLPLSFMGRDVKRITSQDLAPKFDLGDIARDIAALQEQAHAPVDWRWYQEGYDLESTDTAGMASHSGYVTHHQGPQYFGYLANNPALYGKLRGLTDFFTDMAEKRLPLGGVFYIRGGYKNQMGLTPYTQPGTPPAEKAAILSAKSGDDDHPSYSDRQLSEAMAARAINAIAGNEELWQQSAIIFTYDESDGFYDHVPPRILSYGPDGLPLARGLRVPMILISPYARTHVVSHVEGDHNAVIETINAIFGLPALASLPDEAQALKEGNSAYFNSFGPAGFEQTHLGPKDINSPISDSLLSGFSPARLLGRAKPLPATFAMIPNEVVNTLPHYGGQGCKAIGVEPVLPPGQTADFASPEGFNPLPSTYPAAN